MRRQRLRDRSEIGGEDESRLPGEAEQPGSAGGWRFVEPAQGATAQGRVLAPQPQRGPVKGEERTVVSELGADAIAAPVRRLGEPGQLRGRTRGEPETATGAGPGDGHPAAVASG